MALPLGIKLSEGKGIFLFTDIFLLSVRLSDPVEAINKYWLKDRIKVKSQRVSLTACAETLHFPLLGLFYPEIQIKI